jgi:hypothetical protein
VWKVWHNNPNVSIFAKLIGLVSAEILDILGIEHDVNNTINLIIKSLPSNTNTFLPFPKIIMHTRQNLSAVTFLLIIQKKRVLDHVFTPSTFEKPRNIDIDMAKKGIVTE